MRVGLVLVLALTLGACASIVGLDGSDPSQSTNETRGPASGDDDDDGGNASSSSAGSSSSASSSSSSSGGGDPGPDAAPRTDGKCSDDKDCKQSGDKDRCTNRGECGKTCVGKNTPCSTNSTELPCCFGLICKAGALGPLSGCESP